MALSCTPIASSLITREEHAPAHNHEPLTCVQVVSNAPLGPGRSRETTDPRKCIEAEFWPSSHEQLLRSEWPRSSHTARLFLVHPIRLTQVVGRQRAPISATFLYFASYIYAWSASHINLHRRWHDGNRTHPSRRSLLRRLSRSQQQSVQRAGRLVDRAIVVLPVGAKYN